MQNYKSYRTLTEKGSVTVLKNKILKSIKILLETWVEISSGIVTTLIFIAIFYSNHIMINTNKQAILLGITGSIVGHIINKTNKSISKHMNEE